MTPAASEPALLAAARRGDQRAFALLVERHRAALQRHCRRMVGPDDAEDAIQETLLRAWRALPRFRGRGSLRSWLYAIATNTCLTAIEKRRGVIPVDAANLDGATGLDQLGSLWPDGDISSVGREAGATAGIEAHWERREDAAAAFREALDRLAPIQRAALILREVAGLSAAETAFALATSVASVNSALQRARQSLESDGGEPARGAEGADRASREAVESLVAALAREDMNALVGIAADTSPPGERAWSYSAVPAY